MQKTVQRIVSIVLSMVIALSVLMMNVSAAVTASGTCGRYGNNLTWTLENGVLTVSGQGDMMGHYENGDSIPWRLYDDGTVIPKDLRSEIQSVVIGNGVTSIGERAFDGCSNLKNVTIADSVKRIADWAFYECTNLSSVSIGSGSQLTSIGEYAFAYAGFNSIVLPSSLTSVGEGAFALNGSLEEITLPNGLESIPAYMCGYCENLKKVTISGSAQCRRIGNLAFCSTSLTSFSVPSAVQSIGYGAFQFCYSLQNVIFSGPSNALEIIEACAFLSCNKLTTVVLPEQLKSIADQAFERCEGMTSVSFPNSIEHIGNGTFGDCLNLTSVTIPMCANTIGAEGAEDHGIGIRAFEGCTALTSVTLGVGVVGVGTSAFQGCTSLVTLTIEVDNEKKNNLKSIDKNAFNGCSSLQDLLIRGNDLTIGESAFGGCRNLNSLTFSGSGITIGNNAFSGSGSLELTIPDSCVTSIGNSAFSGSGIRSLTIAGGVTGIGNNAFSNCSHLESVTLNGADMEIGAYAFSGDSALQTLTLQSGVVRIGEKAFSGCSSLPEITMDRNSGLHYIDPYAFQDCIGLTNVDLPATVHTIGDCAFYNCTGLTSARVDSSVEVVGESVFFGCTGLAEVTYTGLLHPDWFGDDSTMIGPSGLDHTIRIGLSTDEVAFPSNDYYGRFFDFPLSINGLQNKNINFIASPHNGSYVLDYYYNYSTTKGGYTVNKKSDVFESTRFRVGVPYSSDSSYYYPYYAVTTVGRRSAVFYVHCSSDLAAYSSAWENRNPPKYLFDNGRTDMTFALYVREGDTGYGGGNTINNLYTIKLAEADDFTGQTLTLKSVSGPTQTFDIDSQTDAYRPITTYRPGSSVPIVVSFSKPVPPGATMVANGLTLTNMEEVPSTVISFLYPVQDVENDAESTIHISKIYAKDLNTDEQKVFSHQDAGWDVNDFTFDTGRHRDIFKGMTATLGGTTSAPTMDIRVQISDNAALTAWTRNDGMITDNGDGTYTSTFAKVTIDGENYIYLRASGTDVTGGCLTASIPLEKNTTDRQQKYVAELYLDETVDDELKSEIVFGQAAKVVVPVTNGVCGPDLTWSYDDGGVLTISGTGEMYNYRAEVHAPWSSFTVNEVNIGEGVTSVGNYAFFNNADLSSVTLPDSLTRIGEYAFASCTNLAQIPLPAQLQNTGAHAFDGCTALTEVTLPAQMQNASADMFAGCSSLTHATVGIGTTGIGANAFYNCTALTDIILPAGITSIGANAFDNCSNLETVQYAGTVADWCGVTFGNSAANPLYFAHDLYVSGALVEELVIPGSVRKIGSYAFYEDTSITSVTISDGVTEIGDYAFCNNTSLQSVYIPDSVTTIGDGAFHTCSNLRSVEYVTGRNDVERSIGKYAFAHCDSDDLTNIHIPASVTVIGENAFLGCNSADYSDDFYLCCEATNTVAKEYADNNHIKFVQCNEGANVVAVTFDPGNGTQTSTVYALKDSRLSQPDTPKRDGFTFRGWRLDGEMYDFKTSVTEEITLYGVWIEGEETQASELGGMTESFEEGLPAGWTVENGEGDQCYWRESNVAYYSGDRSMFSGPNSTVGDHTRLITKKMDLSGQSRALNFAYKNARYNDALSGLDVYYRVNQGEWMRLVRIAQAHEDWTTDSCVLPVEALSKGVQFCFEAFSISNVGAEGALGRGVYLDDISFSLFESFENGGIPVGWTVESTPEDTEYIWDVTDSSDANGYVGDCAVWTGTDAAAGNTAWLIMPEMDLTQAGVLTFSYKNQQSTGFSASALNEFGAYYRIYGGAWQELFYTNEGHSDYETETITLPDGAKKESVEIGFCASIDADSTKKKSKGVYLDGISISGNIVSHSESSLQHNVTYSASENVLTATCSNDPCAFENNTLTLTLLAPEMTQARDGKNPAATLIDLGKFNVELELSISADDIRYFNGAQQLEAVPTAAGDYTVSLTVCLGGVNYTITKDYTIAPPEHDYDIPTGLTATFGQTLASVPLPVGWTWDDSSASVGNAGVHTFPATYNGEAHENLTVTVAKATPGYTLPAGLTATVGQTLASVTLPAGWAWNTPTQSVGEAGTHVFAATFTSEDTANYNTVQANLTVSVSAAASVEPQDQVSVTIDDKISINFMLDLDARVNPLIVSVDHMTADGQTTLKTQKFLVSYLTKTDDGLYRISFEMAPAQAADRYVISVDGAAIAQDIFSVADYCYAIRNDPTYGALARATLDYAQAANEVFSYTDVTIADLSKMNTDAIGAYTGGVFADGTGKVSGASFMALTQPEFRFYTSSIAEADAVDYNTAGVTAVYQNGEITDTLNAHFVKNSSGSVLLEVTGVSAEHMNETIVVTITGLGTITFNGNAFAKSLSNSSKPASCVLGAALYNYGEAARACFA